MRISIIIATIIAKIEALEDTDTSARPENCVNLYLTNYLARKENTKAVEQLNWRIFIRAEDSSKDVETGTWNIKLPDNLSLSQTANLRIILKTCVGVRFLLTININVVDKLINDSIGTIEYINFNNPNKPLLEDIYVKFDELTAGNSLKNRLRGLLKECEPMKKSNRTMFSL